jgi:pimeloyl-ACP methyl ester carboxylesterase
MVFVVIALVIAACMLGGALLRTTYFRSKYRQIEPYGQLVDVGDGQMHVYAMGSGKKTIVLLPGLGVALPSAEFGPLMRRLSDKYTVVCVEYFGVGFSSGTAQPRTGDHYVEETRAALSKAGFAAPYVLMGHSISSVYSEYYAAKYPQEVEAIISLDGTSSAVSGETPAIVKYLLPIAKFQQATGLTSLLAPLAVKRGYLLANGYTAKEISDMITFAGFSVNDAVLEQLANSAEFIKQTMVLPFPASIPYFKVISRQTHDTPNPEFKQLHLTPQEYQRKHLERIGGHARYEILDGSHFIYVNNASRIAEIADAVLLTAGQQEPSELRGAM